MAKRGLCMLLAALTAFSLCAPALAQEEPSVTVLALALPMATPTPKPTTAPPPMPSLLVMPDAAPTPFVPAPTPGPTAVPAPAPTATPEPAPAPTATPAPAKPSTLATPKLSKAENTATGVKISWGKVTGAAKYRVFYKGGGKTGWTKLKDTTSTSYTWTGAKSGAKYTFTVRCISKDGKSYTSAYDKTGKSVTYVAAPTVKIAKASGGIKVTWNKAKGASKYMVYYKEGSGGWHKIGATSKTSYTWKKAVSGKTYTFTVRCTDANKKLLSAYKASNSLKYKK